MYNQFVPPVVSDVLSSQSDWENNRMGVLGGDGGIDYGSVRFPLDRSHYSLQSEGHGSMIPNIERDIQSWIRFAQFPSVANAFPIFEINPLAQLHFLEHNALLGGLSAYRGSVGLPFENFKRTDSHHNAADANQNQVDSRQICRSKYETEIAIRVGAGPPCLALGLLLIGIAIWTAGDRDHRIREWACGCSGLALLSRGLAALCLPSHYNCDDYDNDNNASYPFPHGNTVTQKYRLSRCGLRFLATAIETLKLRSIEVASREAVGRAINVAVCHLNKETRVLPVGPHFGIISDQLVVGKFNWRGGCYRKVFWVGDNVDFVISPLRRFGSTAKVHFYDWFQCGSASNILNNNSSFGINILVWLFGYRWRRELNRQSRNLRCPSIGQLLLCSSSGYAHPVNLVSGYTGIDDGGNSRSPCPSRYPPLGGLLAFLFSTAPFFNISWKPDFPTNFGWFILSLFLSFLAGTYAVCTLTEYFFNCFEPVGNGTKWISPVQSRDTVTQK
jgi:hypothetical protein